MLGISERSTWVNGYCTVLTMAAQVCRYEASGSVVCMMMCARLASLLHATLPKADAQMKKLLFAKMKVK